MVDCHGPPSGFFKGTVVLTTPVHGMSASVAGEPRYEWSTESHPLLRIHVSSDGIWLVWPTNGVGMYDIYGVDWKVRYIPIENVAALIPEDNTPPEWLIK